MSPYPHHGPPVPLHPCPAAQPWNPCGARWMRHAMALPNSSLRRKASPAPPSTRSRPCWRAVLTLAPSARPPGRWASGPPPPSPTRLQMEFSPHPAVPSPPQGDLSEVKRRVLRDRVDPSAKQRDGTTPLHHAAALAHVDVVEWLVSQGADPAAKDARGRTPADAARGGGAADPDHPRHPRYHLTLKSLEAKSLFRAARDGPSALCYTRAGDGAHLTHPPLFHGGAAQVTSRACSTCCSRAPFPTRPTRVG